MRVISLGWGVQSFTLAAMVAVGQLPAVDAAVFSDTRWERTNTYGFAARWSGWLEDRGVRVVTVQREGAEGTRVVHKGSVMIPAFTVSADGSRGRIRRQCTGDWKISPLRAWLRSVRGGGPVELWLGISVDEWQRAKDADVKYLRHRWPLLEMGISRLDCIEWLQAHDLEVPPKSSCVFCPFQNKAAWEDLRRRGGADWATAEGVDAEIRKVRPPGDLFVHQRRIPLVDAVEFRDRGVSQAELLANDDSDAECDSGHCFL